MGGGAPSPISTSEASSPYQIQKDLLSTRDKVFRHQVNGRIVVVKKDTETRGSLVHDVQRFAYRVTKFPLLTPTLLPRGISRTRFEADRLTTLRAAGLPVPEVLFVDDAYFVMSDVGDNVERLIRRATTSDEIGAYIQGAVRTLRQFHQAGFAHGGAQLRNFALLDGVVSALDFEEDMGNADLSDMIMRDLIIFTLSVQKRVSDIDPRLICRAYDGNDSGVSYQALARTLNKFQWVSALSEIVPSRFRLTDLRTFSTLLAKVKPPA